jgi:hypothetical protein
MFFDHLLLISLYMIYGSGEGFINGTNKLILTMELANKRKKSRVMPPTGIPSQKITIMKAVLNP